MRFLSNKFCCLFLTIVASAATIFFYDGIFHKNNYTQTLKVTTDVALIDDTVFNIKYQNKTWTFKAQEFEIDSGLFNIDERIERFGRNDSKLNKIKLIEKLIKINIPPDVAFNYIYFGFNNKLNNIAKNVEKMPQNAKIKIKNNKINIENEIIGIKINKYLFYNNLIAEYKKSKTIINLNIPVVKTIPNITYKDLQKYTYKRSEFTTSIATSSGGRKYNVRKALNSINGTHLSKGEKFSFNKCVGSRTAERGYKNAKVILDGEFVEGIGGGVCQVSSTLYNAVLLAGLNVTSSQKHSQRVGYVKAGFDAMVNYGTSDLVFENNTCGDVYILCNYNSDKITISIYGESLGSVSYKREYEIVNPVNAPSAEVIYDTDNKYIDKVLYKDEWFELKPARDGYTIKSYLIVNIDGQQVERKLLRIDKYLPQRGVIVYGTKSREVDTSFVLNEL